MNRQEEAMSESITGSSTLITQPALVAETEKEPFLRFHLEPDMTALLPLQHSAEVISIPRKEIVPIFFMPAWVAGVYNLRGEILWVIDLGHLLGLAPYHQQISTSSNLTTIVLNGAPSGAGVSKVRNQMLGCIVNRLEAIEYCDADQVQPPPSNAAVLPAVLPFVRGHWLKSAHELLAVLDMDAIMAAMPKAEV
jgi:positive phototaxis protein PixI